jgi:hypothetical protein
MDATSVAILVALIGFGGTVAGVWIGGRISASA